MCGFSISFGNSGLDPDKLKHRGVEKFTVSHSYLKNNKRSHYDMTFFKLPFQTSLGDNWNQPIELSDDRYLLFNGEIFNIPQGFENDVDYLKSFFSDENWESKIGGDEYNTWDGFWSICIVTRDGVYAFTDPLGKKQLYYGEKGIASEIKPLLGGVCEPEPNFDYDKVSKTFFTPFKGIERIYPNKLYHFAPEKKYLPVIIKGKLFDLSRKPKSDDFLKLLENAVVSRIHRKGKNSLFLSGGLDSTVILDIIIKTGNKDHFEFVTIENQEDENYIKILEDFYGIQIRRVLSENWKTFPFANKKYLLNAYEYPLEKGSLLPNYFLCQFCSYESILTGDGADELFSGYNRAQINDTQEFDIFTELPYYHNIRLDRMGMLFTKEIRSPFQSHELVRFAINTPWTDRIGKKQIKTAFANRIPQEILNRQKTPLRIADRVEDESKYDNSIKSTFIKNFFKI